MIYEAELKGALNSLELSTDSVYKDLNFRICNLQRQQILMSQALLQQQMQTLRDESGQTVYSHASGEVVEIHKCKSVLVKPRIETEKCCEEMAVWSGRNYQEAAYMKPISKEITKLCTPRVCTQYNLPWFNIGKDDKEEWIKIDKGKILKAEKPNKLKPTSHSKEEQIIIHEDDIFEDEKKDQFRVFSLIHQTRHLLQGEIIQRMYPDEVLTKLNDDIDLEETNTENFISYRLQDAILPWPLNLMHIVPDWLILTILGVIGLFILNIFMDPMLACCNLIHDSSLSLTEKISSAVLPVASISWRNIKRNKNKEGGNIEDVESRITGLEDDMKLFKTIMIKGNDTVNKRLSIAEGTV